MLVRILYIGLIVDPQLFPDMSKKGGRGHIIAVIGILCSGYFSWGGNFCIFHGQVGSTKFSP